MRHLLLIGAWVLLSSGCMKQSWLVDQAIVGERQVKYVLKQSAMISDRDGTKEQLFNYYVRICDLDADGNPSNCADSLVLRDVSLSPR